jgi:endonuclease/exonuclease/phosphatase family metal-dependent hydrolase
MSETPRRSRASLPITAAQVVAILLMFGHRSCAGQEPAALRPLRIATWNVEWFFDHQTSDNASELARSQSPPTVTDWDEKRRAVAAVIAGIRPHILALQEVESAAVLEALVAELKATHDLHFEIAFVQGYDRFTEQDVAFLYRGPLRRVTRYEQTPALYATQQYANVGKHLEVEFEFLVDGHPRRLILLTAHLRSRAEAAPQRAQQALLLRQWLSEPLSRQASLVVLGDFNSEEPVGAAKPDSELGILQSPLTTGGPAALVDLHERLPPGQGSTHLGGKAYDRILVAPSLLEDRAELKDLVLERVSRPADLVIRGPRDSATAHWDRYYQLDPAERDVSDHYPVVADFVWR